MTDGLSVTPEELRALLMTLGLPDPAGVELPTELSEDALDVALRSLVGRGLLLVGDELDVHPYVAKVLVVLLDAIEVLVLSVARVGVLLTTSFHLHGEVGLRSDTDALGNLQLELVHSGPLAEQAKALLASLTSSQPAPELYPFDPEAAKAALSDLLVGRPATLRLRSAVATVDQITTARGWALTDEGQLQGSRVVVGFPDRGAWVVDGEGETPVLTQLQKPWPDVLTQLVPT